MARDRSEVYVHKSGSGYSILPPQKKRKRASMRQLVQTLNLLPIDSVCPTVAAKLVDCKTHTPGEIQGVMLGGISQSPKGLGRVTATSTTPTSGSCVAEPAMDEVPSPSAWSLTVGVEERGFELYGGGLVGVVLREQQRQPEGPCARPDGRGDTSGAQENERRLTAAWGACTPPITQAGCHV